MNWVIFRLSQCWKALTLQTEITDICSRFAVLCPGDHCIDSQCNSVKLYNSYLPIVSQGTFFIIGLPTS